MASTGLPAASRVGDHLGPPTASRPVHAGGEGAHARAPPARRPPSAASGPRSRSPPRRPGRPPARPSGGCPSRSRGRRRRGSARSPRGRPWCSAPRPPADPGPPRPAAPGPRALNWASTMWCGSRPASTRDVQAQVGVEGERLQHVPGQRAGVGHAPEPVGGRRRSARTPGRRGSPVCTQYGRPDTSTTAWASASSSGTSASPNRRMPRLSPSACAERLTEHDRGVLDHVVGVDVHVADAARPRGRAARAWPARSACGRRSRRRC